MKIYLLLLYMNMISCKVKENDLKLNEGWRTISDDFDKDEFEEFR